MSEVIDFVSTNNKNEKEEQNKRKENMRNGDKENIVFNKENSDITNKGVNLKQVCIVGDRLFVDVLMGNEFGCFTILVNPISVEKENFIVRMVRKIENMYL